MSNEYDRYEGSIDLAGMWKTQKCLQLREYEDIPVFVEVNAGTKRPVFLTCLIDGDLRTVYQLHVDLNGAVTLEPINEGEVSVRAGWIQPC